jgi:hypothetical protein
MTKARGNAMQGKFNCLRIATVLIGLFAVLFILPHSVCAMGDESCPGHSLVMPSIGDSLTDYGNTDYSTNDCPQCFSGSPEGPGRDVFYFFDLASPTRLLFSTCNSYTRFDTYLCIYKDACCGAGRTPVFSNDDSPLCGANSDHAAISGCFLLAGRYYLVVTGHDQPAHGAYMLKIFNLGWVDCGEIPPPPCTAGYLQHEEGPDEVVCEHAFTTMTQCPTGYCGSVDVRGDRDVYKFTLTQCQSVTLSCFGNDTPNRSSYHGGLNPRLRLFEDPACDHPLYDNDDYGGNGTDPNGRDSRIFAECLRPGTYWVEISGDTTVGKYEFLYSCSGCQRQVQGVYRSGESQGNNRYCIHWPTVTGSNIYYVWRNTSGITWDLVGTKRDTSFCETIVGAGTPYYAVFTDPCGIPQTDSKK